jgi:hypothetical protein
MIAPSFPAASVRARPARRNQPWPWSPLVACTQPRDHASASLAAERAGRTNSSSTHERSIDPPDLVVVERHHGAAHALRLLANDVQALAVHGHPVANELGTEPTSSGSITRLAH